MGEYKGDLIIRRAENGVILVIGPANGVIGEEFVFTEPNELGQWVRSWFHDLIVNGSDTTTSHIHEFPPMKFGGPPRQCIICGKTE